jgi:Sugar phosphate isomerases/epimerases
MKLATTGRVKAGEFAPIVFRGDYASFIPRAAKIGYDAIELHIHDSAELDRPALKKLLDDNGMSLTSIGTGSAYGEDRIFLSSGDQGVRERAIKRLEDHIVTAADYGAVVIVGLIKGLVKDSPSKEECLKNLDASLKALLPTAEKHRVPLVFEIINRYESDFINTIEDGLSFLSTYNTPWLKLHIDTYHMNIEERDIGASIRKGKGMIGHCHLADSDRWYVGHGHYDFKETLDALRDIGYDGALAVESYMFPDSDTSAVESLKTMRALLGK